MSAPAANNQRPNQAPPRSGGSERPKPRGPVAALVALALAFLASVVTSVFLGTVLEIIGLYTLWPAEGVAHAKSHVAEDLAYIQQFPRSVLVADTVGFAQDMALWARWPQYSVAIEGQFQAAEKWAQDYAQKNPGARRNPATISAVTLLW